MQGPIELQNNVKYYGQLQQQIRSGIGKQVWPDFSIFEGHWLNGKANGKGRLIHSNGDVYEGYWKNDKNDGQGTYTHSDGSFYQGEWF